MRKLTEFITVKNKQGIIFIALFLSWMPFLFTSSSYAETPEAEDSKVSGYDSSGIEEGWVEKKIAPPTQWIESVFAPFTQWMENEIQRAPEEDDPESISPPLPTGDLISIKQAFDILLESHPGKILHSQFKVGPPPHYQIKLLSKQGNVSFFYIHAFNGKLFLPDSSALETQEVKP